MSEVDWKSEVERLAAKSEMHAGHVEAARQHATDPNDWAAVYWEAVYTLAAQRVQMIGHG